MLCCMTTWSPIVTLLERKNKSPRKTSRLTDNDNDDDNLSNLKALATGNPIAYFEQLKASH